MDSDPRKNSLLMGILYGVIFGLELSGQPITYHQVETIMMKHCTPQELTGTMEEVHRYHEKLLQIEATR